MFCLPISITFFDYCFRFLFRINADPGVVVSSFVDPNKVVPSGGDPVVSSIVDLNEVVPSGGGRDRVVAPSEA